MLKFTLFISIVVNIALVYWIIDLTQRDNATTERPLPSVNNNHYQSRTDTESKGFVRDKTVLENDIFLPHIPKLNIQTTQKSAQFPDQFPDQAWSSILQLVENQQWTELGEPLRTYLRLHPQHAQALFLETQWLFYTVGELAGISAMYQLSEQTNETGLQSQLNQFISSFTHSKITRLTREQDWQNLALFVEPLYALDPDSRSFIRALGTAYAYLNLPTAMEDTLANLPSDDTLVRYVRDIWTAEYARGMTDDDRDSTENTRKISNHSSTKDATTVNMDIIPLKRMNQQFFAPVSFAITGGSFTHEQVQTELLIDTGASITALSPVTFAQIPAQAKTFQRNVNVNTANGMVQTELYHIAEVRLGEQVFTEVEVLVLPDSVSDNTAFDGLLGMNMLAQFTFFIDQDNGLLELSELR